MAEGGGVREGSCRGEEGGSGGELILLDDFLGILTALFILFRLLITKYWVTRIIITTSVALTGGVKCGLVNPYLGLRLVFHWPDTNSVRSAGFKSINASSIVVGDTRSFSLKIISYSPTTILLHYYTMIS